jgi:hypothetical protein
MNQPAVRLFQGFFFDVDKDECLLYVAKEDCNREVEFRKAYRNRYGQSADNVEIFGVYLVSLLCHNGVEKEYRIQVGEK